jgi:acyl carrier protein
VKVRGFRVGLGEIEAVLRGHPAVRDAAVVAHRDSAGGVRLAAYAAPADATPAALRAFVKERVPEHMVPSAFAVLDALPLTPSGKLDRRALPAPDFAADESAFVAPRTPTEEIVAGMFAEVLAFGEIQLDGPLGTASNFFALGGHSLLATRLMARVQETFGVDLPLRVLFEAPTVAGLADHVDALRRADLPVLAPIVPVDRCRSRSRRSGCGSRSGSSPAGCTTTPPCCGWAAPWTARPWPAPWARSSAGTRPCARPSPRPTAPWCRSSTPSTASCSPWTT